jgi:hypothetical protein
MNELTAKFMADIDQYKIEGTSMNYRNSNTLRVLQLQGSACFEHVANYQRRISIYRESVR